MNDFSRHDPAGDRAQQRSSRDQHVDSAGAIHGLAVLAAVGSPCLILASRSGLYRGRRPDVPCPRLVTLRRNWPETHTVFRRRQGIAAGEKSTVAASIRALKHGRRRY